MGFIIKGSVGGVVSGTNTFPTLYFPSSFPPYIIQDNIPAEPIAFIAILKKYVL